MLPKQIFLGRRQNVGVNNSLNVLYPIRKLYLGSSGYPVVIPPVPPVTYTVEYNGNESTGGEVPVDVNSPYLPDSIVTVLGNTGNLVKTGYAFNNWNTLSGGTGTDYSSGDTFTITGDTTLYAQWEPQSVAYFWNGSVDGDLGKAENYTPNGIPKSFDTVIINNGQFVNAPSTGNLACSAVSGTATIIYDSGISPTFVGTPIVGNPITINVGMLDGGTTVFTGDIVNKYYIFSGTFNGNITNESGAYIYGGTFNGSVSNNGNIADGTFVGEVWNNWEIYGGTFNGVIINNMYLDGGTVNGTVINYNIIYSSGIFNGIVSNYGYIYRGTFTAQTRAETGGTIAPYPDTVFIGE